MHGRDTRIAGAVASPYRRPMPTPRLLVTGFDAFPGAPVNPTERAVRRLADRFGADRRIAFHVVGTNYESAFEALRPILDDHRPDFVLMTGVDRRARALRLETTARNAIDGTAPDNRGHLPAAARIVDPGEARLAATWPPDSIADIWREHRIAHELSDNAGAYLCNFLYYSVLRHAALAPHPFRAVFVHTPMTEEALAACEGDAGSDTCVLAAAALEQALRVVIEAVLDGRCG